MCASSSARATRWRAQAKLLAQAQAQGARGGGDAALDGGGGATLQGGGGSRTTLQGLHGHTAL